MPKLDTWNEMTKIYPSKTFSNRMQRFLKWVSKNGCFQKIFRKKFTRQSPRGPQTQTDELWNARKLSTHGETAFDTEFLYWTRRFSVSFWTMWSWWTYSRKFEHIRDCVVFSYKKIWNKSTRFLKHTFKIKLHLCCIAWLCLCTICANL